MGQTNTGTAKEGNGGPRDQEGGQGAGGQVQDQKFSIAELTSEQ